MFDLKDIKVFKLSELNGKTINVFATKDDVGNVIVMGYDTLSQHCYVLGIEKYAS